MSSTFHNPSLLKCCIARVASPKIQDPVFLAVLTMARNNTEQHRNASLEIFFKNRLSVPLYYSTYISPHWFNFLQEPGAMTSPGQCGWSSLHTVLLEWPAIWTVRAPVPIFLGCDIHLPVEPSCQQQHPVVLATQRNHFILFAEERGDCREGSLAFHHSLLLKPAQ